MNKMVARACTGAVLLALVMFAGTVVTAQRQLPLQSHLQQAAYTLVVDKDADAPIVSDNRAGRFLHITDMHPDQFYQAGTKINDACHQIDQAQAEKKKKKKKKGKDNQRNRAGYWGAPVSVCDAPQRLIASTFDWLAQAWTEQVATNGGEQEKAFDFIIWTGDTARHDIDFTHPRKAEEIFEYNRWALKELQHRFPNTPIVPNVGNNDIIPHNIMFPGPNSMTRAYRDIWAMQIPAEQHESFLDGGYFVSEVLPNDLAVISLNTLYWYDSNAATRGCKKHSEPGSIQLDWLAEQLSALRNRSMQAHLIGHVPPTAGNYFADCYEQYTDIALRFQDTIVGQHFGHMNIDAMFLQEDVSIAAASNVADANVRQQVSDKVTEEPVFEAQSLASDLRKDYDLVPTQQKTNLDAYLPFFVAPSVVPTYLPTVRVWTYNNSKPDAREVASMQQTSLVDGDREDAFIEEEWNDDVFFDDNENVNFIPNDGNKIKNDEPLTIFQRSHRRPRHRGKKRRNRRRKLARHASSNSPSRSAQYLTLLGYSQWVLDLPRLNKLHEERLIKRSTTNGTSDDKDDNDAATDFAFQIEYTTYDERTLWSDYLQSFENAANSAAVSHVHRPVPKRLLDRELARRQSKPPEVKATQRQNNSSSTFSTAITVPDSLRRLTDYRLPSMTVKHVLDWARELAGNDALWKRYEDRIYTESGFQE